MRQTLLLLSLVTWTFFSLAQETDKSSSPYFVVSSPEKGKLLMPLQHTEAEVNIAGTIADVRITQVYQNTGTIPLEAVYVFPASTRAAVYAMDMKIGEREIEATIKEKAAARKNYEQAKKKGQTASLLEQHRPNVFQMNVANIMPGDSIIIHLSYTELLIPKEGIYEFVYPTVVGPRYTRGKKKQTASSKNWPANPTTKQGKLPTYTFGFKGRIAGGVPVQNLQSPSHELDIDLLENGTAQFILSPDDKKGGNRDLVFRYSLKGETLSSGMLTYQEKGEKFFLWTVQPPARIEPSEVTAREYIFIVDVSGSMNGFPLDITKELLRNLIGDLDKTDRFNVILFAGASNIMDKKVSVPATKANINRAIRFIENESGAGGTSLLPALERGLALKETAGFARSFVLCTDGYVTVENDAYDLVRKNLGKANFFTFGMGSSVNRALIEGLAEVGKGEAFVAMNGQESKTVGKKFQTYIQSPILTDITASFGDMKVYDIEPLGVPDVFSDRPIVIFGKYKGKLNGTATLRGVSGKQPYLQEIDLSHIRPEKENRALRYLWARERIHRLSDIRGTSGAKSSQKEVVALGLQYNLLTQYTSFVAVDKKVRNDTGQDTTIKQVLPLPKGVSDKAIGGKKRKKYSSNTVPYTPAQASGSAFSETMKLEEVVVVGYGTVQKSSITSAVSTVKESHGIRSAPGAILQGKLSGVQVLQSSGVPASHTTVQIRGMSSAVRTEPLIVVDGIVQESLPSPSNIATGMNGTSESWQQLSGEEISSISVLKSATASAIYGARASNGVILITTKKSRYGDPTWTWSSQIGLNTPSKKGLAYSLPYTLQTGIQQQHFLRFQKKQDKQSFYASLQHKQDQGVIPESDWQQLSARLRYERSWKKEWKSEIEWTGNQQIQRPLMLDWLGLDSIAQIEPSRQTAVLDAFSAHNRSRHMQGRAKVKGNIFSWMNWQSDLSWQGNWIAANQYVPFSPWGRISDKGYQEQSQTFSQQLQQTHQLSLYPKSLGKWTIEGRFTWQHIKQDWSYDGRLGLDLEEETSIDDATTQHTVEANLVQENHLLGQHIALRWNEIIASNLSLSSAQMSRGKQNLGWKLFPAASLNINSPHHWELEDIIDPKISISYSEMGNDRLPIFAFGSPHPSIARSNPYYSSFFFRQLAGNNLDWEVSKQWDAGIEIHLFNQRISLRQDVYHKMTHNFWSEVPVPTDEGMMWTLQNVGNVLQRGTETSITTRWYAGNWRLSWNGNMTVQQNEVKQLYDQESIQTGTIHPLSGEFVSLGSIEVGHPLGSFRGYQVDEQGRPIGEPVILGSAMPNFFYGSDLQASYKQISFQAKVYGATGQEVLNLNRRNGRSMITEDMVESADYLRISDLSMKINLPMKHVSWIQNLELRTGVSNVVVFSSYSGFDPEVNVLGQQRSSLIGVDAAAYPRPRTYWLGVELHIK